MEGLTVADALALQDRGTNDDMMGGNGMWMMMFLFFILAAGGNGGGIFGGNNGATNQINNDFLYTNLNSTLGQGFTQVANQNFGIQKDLCQGFSGIDKGICDIQHSQDMCCCTTNRNIDAIRYENAKNTCDITNAIHADGEATRALINANTMQNLRDQLNSANNTLSNTAQTQNILNSLGRYVTNPPCNPCSCM